MGASDSKERSRDSPELRAFARRLAGDDVVLLKNEGDLLALTSARIIKFAIIGPNAHGRVILFIRLHLRVLRLNI